MTKSIPANKVILSSEQIAEAYCLVCNQHEILKTKVREMLIFLCSSNPRTEGERLYGELEELVK